MALKALSVGRLQLEPLPREMLVEPDLDCSFGVYDDRNDDANASRARDGVLWPVFCQSASAAGVKEEGVVVLLLLVELLLEAAPRF